MKYLTAQDIAEELGVSRSRAYEIMRECTRLVSGRSVRIVSALRAIEAWIREGGAL